ncbi:MAG TPA: hypothetical protein PLU22_27345, partial [Polyangiaceae bacterium]|nr:hypothetical protein [Polyangiaceae bacterium]
RGGAPVRGERQQGQDDLSPAGGVELDDLEDRWLLVGCRRVGGCRRVRRAASEGVVGVRMA